MKVALATKPVKKPVQQDTLSKYPTRTATLEKQLLVRINKRYNLFKKEMLRYVFDDNGLNILKPASNKVANDANHANHENHENHANHANDATEVALAEQKWVYRYDKRSATRFQKWATKRATQIVLTGTRFTQPDLFTNDNLLLNKTIATAYARGVNRGEREIITAGHAIGITAVPLSLPVHKARATFIYSRAYEDLTGVNQTMAQQMGDLLSQGIVRGENPYTTARAMTNRVDKIGKVRAKLIARTETTLANNMGSIAQGQVFGKATGLDVKYKWITAKDEKVRPLHRYLSDRVMAYKTVLRYLGAPNCRCAVIINLPDTPDV